MTNKPICRQYQRGIRLPLTALLLAIIVSGISSVAIAADTQGTAKSADDVARELANPNSSLATLTVKNQYRWYTGDLPGADDQDNYTMIFQPVFPLSMPKSENGDARTVFLRPGFPILFDQPVPGVENGALDWDGVTALGDVGFDIGYGVSQKSGFLWAVGMVGTLPTATDEDVAGKQVRLGPEFLLARFEKWGIYGIFPSHQWDVTGWSDKSFNTTQFQPVLKFILPGGWTAGSSPIGNYDWEGEEWTIPVNLSVSKTVMFGETPWKFELEANYYVEQPDAFGPQWMIGFNISPVVNNPFQKGFNRLIGVK
ncbi:hypothetical protein [Desulforhopalus sp. 52FAK]